MTGCPIPPSPTPCPYLSCPGLAAGLTCPGGRWLFPGSTRQCCLGKQREPALETYSSSFVPYGGRTKGCRERDGIGAPMLVLCQVSTLEVRRFPHRPAAPLASPDCHRVPHSEWGSQASPEEPGPGRACWEASERDGGKIHTNEMGQV